MKLPEESVEEAQITCPAIEEPQPIDTNQDSVEEKKIDEPQVPSYGLSDEMQVPSYGEVSVPDEPSIPDYSETHT